MTPKPATVTIQMSHDLRRRARLVAVKEDITLSELIRRAIDDYLKRWADEPNNIIFLDE